MPPLYDPILLRSFTLIDTHIGPHSLTAPEYAITRRVIHSTGDWEFKDLIHCSPGAIEAGLRHLQQGGRIVTDVGMVYQGVVGMVERTFGNPLTVALDHAPPPLPDQTRSAAGIIHCLQDYPEALYVIGNAPTALLALCELAPVGVPLVIATPVGFIHVLEAKAAIAASAVPHILVEGHKGGAGVAAAILNALLVLAWESQ